MMKVFQDLDVDGSVEGTSFIKTGGTSSQFLKADGSIDSTAYAGAYVHPTYNGDDFSVDTGALTGAVVVSDIDINLTSDGLGHVVDANAYIATRTLTLANLGYTGATNANNYVHPSYATTDINTSTSTIIDSITTNSTGHITAMGTRVLTLGNLGFTGATNANYITNNNQLSNGAGYITAAGNSNLSAEAVEDIMGAAWISGTNNTFVYDDAAGTLRINSVNTNTVYTHPSYASTNINTSGATIVDIITTNGTGHVTALGTRVLTLAELGYTGSTTANNYVHPTYAGDDMAVDTGALTGAVVISDLDFNVTTDTQGHVTDANASVSTRTLTLGNLGFTGASNANYITNNNQLSNGAGYITSAGNTNTQRTDEEIRDVAAAQWIDGTNTTVVKDDANNTIKINASGGGGSGTVTSVSGGTGITQTGTSTVNPTISLDYLGTDNFIENQTYNTNNIGKNDTLLVHNVTNGNVQKIKLQDLPSNIFLDSEEWSAKGDVVVGTTNNAAAILSVGSNGKVLTANSFATNGVSWETPTGGSGGGDIEGVTAGDGLGGGGTTGTVSLNVDSTVVRTSGTQTVAGNKTFTGTTIAVTPSVFDDSTKVATTAWVKDQGYGSGGGSSGVSSITGSTGIDASSSTGAVSLTLDLNELTLVTPTTGLKNTDQVAIVDGTASRKVKLDDIRKLDTGTSTNTASGTIIAMVAAETITVGDALYMTSTEGRVGVAHANNGSNDPPCMGIAVNAATNGQTLDVLIHGIADFSVFPLWTVGAVVYLSDSVSGGGGLVSTTAPNDNGDTVQVLGIAMGPDKMLFNPSYNTIIRS